MSDLLLPLGLIVVLILLNGAFAGTEIAVVSLREGQLQRIEQKGSVGRRVAALARDSTRFLSTIQIGINIVAFLSAIAASQSFTDTLAGALDFLGGAARPVAILLITLVLTYVTIVFGELVPKRLAVQRAENWALKAARPIGFLARIARPAVWLLGASTNFFVKLLGGDPNARQEEVTEEEVRDIIATQIDVTPEQREILAGAFEVAERVLREIVVPRSQVTAIEAETPMREAIEILVRSGHSRAPVYAGDMDDVLGVVHLRDLLDESGTAADHVRAMTVLPETVPVLDALRRLRIDRQRMALVVNEHGGTEGIVTIEDLLEEIVGDLYDEFDQDLASVVKDEDGSVVLPGDYPVHDLPDIGVELPEGPYATVAGYVLSRLGAIAEGGEVLESDGWRIEVLEIEGRAIRRLRLTPLPSEDGGDDDDDS
jgi:putative hemolysin